MDCAEFKEQVALLALGGLDEVSRRACADHLNEVADHQGCVEELEQNMKVVSALVPDKKDVPANHVWLGIQRQIAPSALRLRRVRTRSQVAIVVAVACAAALVVLLVGDWHRDQERAVAENSIRDALNRATTSVSTLGVERDACLTKIRALEGNQALRGEAVDLLQLPGTKLFALAPAKGRSSSANAILHTGVKRAYVIADGLPRASDGDYEMWVAKGSRVVAAGLVHVDAGGRAVVRIDYASLLGPAAGPPDAVMITLEPPGGGSVVRGPTILLGAIKT